MCNFQTFYNHLVTFVIANDVCGQYMPLRLRVDGFADGETRISHHIRAKTVHVYITLHPRQKQGQNAIAHACDGFADGGTRISHHKRAAMVTLRSMQKQGQNAIAHACGRVCRWWDTYITPQSCQDCYHVYHASFNAKTRTKRHCACVWTGLQMVGHIYHTTIVPRLLSCISRFVQCKNKDKTPLRMRVDGFADGGTHISHHNRAKTAIMYMTLRSMQKQGQNAIAHACGRVCRWWDTYITPQSCFVLHVLSLSLFRESHCLFV